MDGKKKRNRRKKGNQNKVAEDASSNAEELAAGQGHGSSTDQNHYVQVSSNLDAQSVGVSGSDIEMDRHKEELERHKVCEERFVSLHEEVRQLEKEKDTWRQREAKLEEKINTLQNQVDSFIQHDISFQEKFNFLQTRNDVLTEKEALLEERMKQIEGIKDTWMLKEISCKDMIASVQEVNAGLQIRVKELEESRSGVGEENRQLMDAVLALESRIQQLEEKALYFDSSILEMAKLSEEKHLPPYEMETADEPVKQDADAELVKKANGIHPEPDQQDIAEEHMTTHLNHIIPPIKSSSPTDYASEYQERIFEPDGILRPSARDHGIYDLEIGVKGFDDAEVGPGHPPELDDSRRSEEIVQIPLDDTPTQETDSQFVKMMEADSAAAVPLTDAPLIGAPFRLISFFAKYVSGSDLVNESSSKSGR